jgi:NADPH-dependent 2,4-dienoyl-CoA reductase/sulfur reductase-like enzyme/nitrite reductase/ring-hydroxylating ferredoxin subunit
MGGATKLEGPDLAQGIAKAELVQGRSLVGHAGGEAVLLARVGEEIVAVGASCTHYGGPLGEGLIVDGAVRCPWHHACFDLRTGAALRAPALSSIPCFAVEERDGKLYVLGKKAAPPPKGAPANAPSSIVIIGGGAAGHAAAEMLRREGYAGKVTILSADPAPPVDRPNLSKDYLAGNAPEEWIPLRPPEAYAEQRIDLVLGASVSAIDLQRSQVVLEGGATHPYGALLLATGADAVHPSGPGMDQPHVHTLRTLADCRAILARVGGAKRAVVLGASFIGLEVAASLRTRGLEVHVVAPEARPLERVLGPEVGDAVRAIHEEHGVVFHLGQTAKAVGARDVTLANDDVLAADFVVAGVGVRPSLALAEKAGLRVDRGIAVDSYLQTSAERVFAAGDVARWPDPRSGSSIRVEHWVVAQRMGQIAARNILGQKVPCDLVPFFWSQHYDMQISYVGHAEAWDRIEIDGSLAKRDATVRYVSGQRALAVVTIGRDAASLAAEVAMERERA